MFTCYRYFLFVIAVLLSLTMTASAQESVAPPQITDAVSKSPDDPKLPIEKIPPYSKWEHHVAEKAEEAIVPVHYSEAGKENKILATGLVVRCDGFVLVPRIVRDTGRLGGLIQVTLAKVDGDNSKEPITVAARYSPRTHATVPYGLIKTNGYHVRCLPMLASENVTTGKSVRILWQTAKEEGRTAVASREATVGATTSTLDTYTLSPTDQSTDSIPSGAFVIDKESGAAIGMVTQEGTHPAFVTLARFNVISNDVGLAPDRAAVRLGDRSGSLPPGSAEMVWVPGGAVPLDGITAKEFTRDYGVTIACTPGVWVAVQPVTNGEYRSWLSKELVRRLPYGWMPGDIEKPMRREDLPVCGMIPDDASIFASTRHSRLPTEVEWRRAAYTQDISWVEEMNIKTGREKKQFADLFLLQRRYAAELVSVTQEAARQNMAANRNRIRPGARINPIYVSTPEMDSIAGEIMQFADMILSDDTIWGQVVPVDAYRQDRSLFGVRNVLINAPELVLSRVQGTTYASKLFPAQVDPYLSYFSWSASGVGGAKNNFALGRYAQDNSPAWMLQKMIVAYFLLYLWNGGSASIEEMSSSVEFSKDQGANAAATSFGAQASTNIKATFRCAR